jgi:hypothetical protein
LELIITPAMKLKQLLILISTVLLYSCNNDHRNNISAILNEGHLLSEGFSVNIICDTTLLTKNGRHDKMMEESMKVEPKNCNCGSK